jgi:hypothetical protein
MRHDQLLQVILVESNAIRPICLLHGCDYWSARASLLRRACRAGAFWVTQCPLHHSRLKYDAASEFLAEKVEHSFSVSPGSASHRCGPGRRGPPLTRARGAVSQV